MQQAMQARLSNIHAAPGAPAVVALLAAPVGAMAKPPLDWPAPWRSLCLTAALHCATREPAAMVCGLVSLADAWLAPDTRIAAADRVLLEQWLGSHRSTPVGGPVRRPDRLHGQDHPGQARRHRRGIRHGLGLGAAAIHHVHAPPCLRRCRVLRSVRPGNPASPAQSVLACSSRTGRSVRRAR